MSTAAIYPPDLINRVIGMLMHLWALVDDPEIRRTISETMEELRQVVDAEEEEA